MSADDVKNTLDLAVTKTGITGVRVRHRPRLLSDNGPCYLARDLKQYLDEQGISHTRGKPCHPMTQGKIERYHRTLKNRINLENYYLPWDLEHQIGRFVDYYNHRRVHESPGNLTPADVYYGRAGQRDHHGQKSGQGTDYAAQDAPEPGAEAPKRRGDQA